MLEESIEQSENEAYNPSRYFLAHRDAEISKIAAEIVSDRYQLSKVHIKQFGENLKKEDTPLAEEKHLWKNVPRAVTELKDAYISKQMKYIKEEMEQKQKAGDWDGAI